MWIKENMPDQTGKTVIVTGSNVGVGFETAMAFYEKGAHVLVASRSLKNAGQAINKMKEKKGKGSLEPGVLDLSDLHVVKEFADSFVKKHRELCVNKQCGRHDPSGFNNCPGL